MRCSPFVVLILFVCVSHSYAQSSRITWDQLGLVYAEARSQMLYQAYIESNGEYVLPFGPSRSQVASDSLLDWIAETMGLREKAPPPVFRGEIHTWDVISLADQPDGLVQYEDVRWSYLGNNFFTSMDTMDTSEIRAHFEAYFGSPTQTVVEIKQEDHPPRDDYSQFEYWFVVNDSIPMIVMDVGGALRPRSHCGHRPSVSVASLSYAAFASGGGDTPKRAGTLRRLLLSRVSREVVFNGIQRCRVFYS